MTHYRIFLLLCCCTVLWQLPTADASCVDSVRLVVKPVQCYGLRNGMVRVDTVYGGEKPFYYSIDGQTFSTRPEFESLWAGHYTIYVRDASNCVHEQAVYVPQPDELKVHIIALDTSVEAGIPIQVTAEYTPSNMDLAAVEWRPPSLFKTPGSLTQTIYPEESAQISVEIRSTSECYARDHLNITVEKTNVYIPNVMKPGSNQDAYFTIFAGEGVSKVTVLQVYSRNGGLIFEQRDFQPNDPLKGWNGRWRGKYVQPGVYSYIATVEYLTGGKRDFQGTVTVVN